jgi:hypothetical protein
MILARKQQIDRPAVQVCAPAEICSQQRQRDDSRALPSRALFWRAHFFVHQADQHRQQKPQHEQQECPQIKIVDHIPPGPVGAEGPEKLDSHAAREIEQHVSGSAHGAHRERRAEVQRSDRLRV